MHALSETQSDLAPEVDARAAIAVVGTSHVLAKHLIALLEEDPLVRRIVIVSEGQNHELTTKARAYQLDMTAPGSEFRLSEILTAERVGTVLQLTSLAVPAKDESWAHEYESIGAMRVVAASRQARVKKIIAWSHTWVYGANPSNPNHLGEDTPLFGGFSSFVSDKIEAEEELARFAKSHPEVIVTVLRTAPIVGPRVDTLATRYLSSRLAPTLLGFDPLVQVVHEIDALAAFKFACDHDLRGVYNVVGAGVLPLSTVLRLAGARSIPIPEGLAKRALSALWMLRAALAPPEALRFLRYLCVADGSKILEAGFQPAFSTQEAILDFAQAQRLRDTHLLGSLRR
jgi:UDP-glucose 4-epimerase